MLLENKNVIVYGAGGAIGGAAARVFAREGAKVFLTGRTIAPLEAAAKEIAAQGGFAEAALVDALDQQAVKTHADAIAARHGRIDVAFNAIGLDQHGIQGEPLIELALDRFTAPIHTYMTSHFLTARAAGRHMVRQGSGVILTLTATPSRVAAPLVGGMAPAWAGIEALTRVLAAELGPHGVRVACLRSDAIPETATIEVVFGQHADALGITRPEFTSAMADRTLLKRLPTLAEVAEVAAFLASDKASAMTATVVNLSGGSIAE
jgi:NAD(P)-dependent dehydrogenase (short-subunit alcohol dehydrogenase family)